MFCSKCGEHILGGNKFCQTCGTDSQSVSPTEAPIDPLYQPSQTLSFQYGAGSDNTNGHQVPRFGFVSSVSSGFKNYFNFKSRSTRAEYWWFVLFYQVMRLMAVADMRALLLSVASAIALISASARRMHDTNRSGWFALIPSQTLSLLARRVTSRRTALGSPLGHSEDWRIQTRNWSWMVSMYRRLTCGACLRPLDAISVGIRTASGGSRWSPRLSTFSRSYHDARDVSRGLGGMTARLILLTNLGKQENARQ